VLVAFLLVRTITSWRPEGDTVVLINHTEQILDCLRSGIFHGCTIVHFPLFQFIPALLLKLQNASDTAILAFFAWLNWAAFAAAVVVMWSALRAQASRTVALVAVFVLLTSPFLPYTVETFNEPTAAFLTLAFSVAVLTGARLRWVAALCVLSTITKETAPPFLFLIGLLGLFRRHDPPRSKGKYTAVLLLAAGMGIAVNSGFNYFRYGSLLNVQNLAPEFRVDTLEQGAINFAGIWLSPNGGALLFWPSFACICVVILLAAVAERPSWAVGPWPARLLAVLLFGLTLGLSSWYSPHGWFAWGPRLLLPWLPATVYLTCYFYPGAIEQGAASLSANRWRFWIATALFVAFAVPSFFALLDARLLGTLFQPDDVFPRPMRIQEDRAGYFAQLNYVMWSKRSMLIDCYNWVLQSNFRDKVLLYVVCIAVLAEAIAASARNAERPT
jgi:hypothetical protein